MQTVVGVGMASRSFFGGRRHFGELGCDNVVRSWIAREAANESKNLLVGKPAKNLLRQLMLEEIALDVSLGSLYLSKRLSPAGQRDYPSLLCEAARSHDIDWLADLRQQGRMNGTEQRRNRSGGYTTARVPVTAPDTAAEGEFNRFYARALCRRAIAGESDTLVVYRAKQVDQPRAESLALIGTSLDPTALLADLRAHPGMDTALRLPPGPNSGLSVRLP